MCSTQLGFCAAAAASVGGHKQPGSQWHRGRENTASTTPISLATHATRMHCRKSHQFAVRGMIEPASHPKPAQSRAHVVHAIRLARPLRVRPLAPVHAIWPLHRHRPHCLCTSPQNHSHTHTHTPQIVRPPIPTMGASPLNPKSPTN